VDTILPMTIPTVLRPWFAALFASCAGIGLYVYDDFCEAMEHSWLKSTLNALEVIAMGPGLGALAWVLVENARLNADAARRRLELERDRRFQMLGRIAASVAHEFRNPLHNLRLLVDEVRVSGAEPRLLERVDGNIRRLDQTVHLVYELARPPRQPEDAELEQVPLKAAVDSAVQEAARRAGRLLSVEHHPPPSDLPVRARPDALRIALDNLVRNAVEAAGDAGISIDYEENEREAVLVVRNPGSLPQEIAEGASIASEKPHGLGVGLGIARHLVAQCGGRVDLAAADGTVTTRLTLPIGTRTIPAGDTP
jgi:two-component system C4-dicarboxylate transport sensor histidine kinase DctB